MNSLVREEKRREEKRRNEHQQFSPGHFVSVHFVVLVCVASSDKAFALSSLVEFDS